MVVSPPTVHQVTAQHAPPRNLTKLGDLVAPAHNRDSKAFFDCVCEVCPVFWQYGGVSD